MVTDPIGDFLIQIKNAAWAAKPSVELPYSKVKMAIGKTLKDTGYLTSVEVVGTEPKKRLRIELAYKDGAAVLGDVKRKSKPGLRRYVGKNEIPLVVGGMGIAIISTPQGIMTGRQAKKKGLGGELICEVW